MHVSKGAAAAAGRGGAGRGQERLIELSSPSLITFFSTRPVSRRVPVFMLFTAVHRPHRLGIQEHRASVVRGGLTHCAFAQGFD